MPARLHGLPTICTPTGRPIVGGAHELFILAWELTAQKIKLQYLVTMWYLPLAAQVNLPKIKINMTVSTSPVSPSYTSLPRAESDIEARVIELRNSAKLTARSKKILAERLQDIAKEAKLGQVGAQGEITFLQRQVAHGDMVELLPDDKHLPSKKDRRFTKKPAKKFGRKFPDFRLLDAGTGEPEIIEVKTTDQTPRQWHTFMRSHIDKANRQVKRSSLQKGKPGAVAIQLYDQAARDFVHLPAQKIERLIKRSFNPTRSTSLRRVSIYINGRLFFEYRRDERGDVYRTEFRGGEKHD